MSKPRAALILALGLVLSAAPNDVGTAAEPPKIRKPQPAPSTPPNVPPLPPAHFDPTLAVGGEDVKARKIETRPAPWPSASVTFAASMTI